MLRGTRTYDGPFKGGASNRLCLGTRIPRARRVGIHVSEHPLQVVRADLRKLREAWLRYQSTEGREAVYIYLAAVFDVVSRWRRAGKVDQYCGLALSVHSTEIDMEPEPFAFLIFCTADPAKVDKKTRSKWSRALRVVQWNKRESQSVRDCIKSVGGINACAAFFRQI